jgi:hypothetical protein
MRSLLTLVIGLAAAGGINAADFVGTWKVSPEKSQFAGDLVETLRIEQTAPHTFRIIFDGVRKSGGKLHEEVTEVCDGREYPRAGSGSKTEGRTDICETVNGSNLKVTQKENGKVISENTFTLSSNPDVLIHLRTGQGAHNWVAERQ